MKIYILTTFLTLFTICLQAQFIENFTDGNFTNNPAWQGDTELYVVNSSFELQNMDTDGGSSYLSVPAPTADSTTWEFYFRLEFAPSTSNQMRVYLNASQADLTGPQDAYFVQVGASGGDDAVEFRRQDGTGSTLLLSTPIGSAATDPEIRVRVTRNQNQEWELLADLTGGTNFQSYGMITDATHPQGQYFGFSNKYTSTRVDKFFFDDILISPLFMDLTPPVFVSAIANDNSTVVLQFNEPLDPATAQMIGNYSFTPAVNVISAMIDNTDPARVLLTVEPLTNGVDYTVTATGIGDLESNIASAQTQNFLFLQPLIAEANDILINEIMADPAPEVGLPLFEFVELYNRSDKIIDLENFTISDADNSADPLPAFTLLPDSYVIICEAANATAFTSNGFGPVVGVNGLPALNNGEDRISLHNSDNTLIHTILYQDDWYRDADKMDGGWTLELINPNLYCLGADNWIASNDADGGTPGRANSVLNNTPDTTPPALLSATPISATELSILFNEVMSEAEVENPANYVINPGNFSPTSVTLNEEGTMATAFFSTNFMDLQEYDLTVNSVSDCVGNNIAGSNTASFTFFITTPADQYDIIINEIMANPTPEVGLPAFEFVELYNRSDKTINLENFIISDANNSADPLPAFTFLPDSYVIICDAANATAFTFSGLGPVIGVNGLPALNNGEDRISLHNSDNTLIHTIFYRDDWYRDTDKMDGGWTLELINPNLYCLGADNWIASNDEDGGTPGRVNSVLDNTPDNTPPTLLSATPISATELSILFNEVMSEAEVENPANYIITPGNFSPTSVTLNEEGTMATAFFSTSFMDRQEYDLTVNSVSDCVGNSILGSITTSFTFFTTIPAERYDIIINEIYATPTPSHGLPELEFVELYNRSDKAINLENYTFDEGSSSGNTLPFFVLVPGAYVILQKANSDDFGAYGDVIQLDNFALTNGGELLNLQDQFGNTIDAVEYDDDWGISGRIEGYSLERINPDNICTNGKTDWSSSFADLGGTPGSINNIFDQSNPNNNGPELTKVYMNRDIPNQVVLSFDQALDPMTVNDVNSYSITPADHSVISAILVSPIFNEVNILLNEAVNLQTIYTIEVDVTSCKNNSSTLDQSGQFAISEEIEVGDLILNEILHNPFTSGSRFIELYNQSDKVVDVKDLFMGKRIGLDSLAFDEEVETPCLFFPNQYIVLTPDPEDVLARYEVENPNLLVETELPTYDDDEDQVVLMIQGSVILDELSYTRDFHNALLDDRNGVSLERIDPNMPTQNIGNWASAAETAGFATPTYQNSQFSERINSTNENKFISLSETTISPDGDGFQDALIIDYQTTGPGFLAKVRIYDARGRLVKQLNQQTLIAAEGSLKWDGSTDNNEKAPIGIYVLVAEFVHPDGRVQTDKETIVVAGRLE